jgi:thioredoxin-like negative regulator of GroEL
MNCSTPTFCFVLLAATLQAGIGGAVGPESRPIAFHSTIKDARRLQQPAGPIVLVFGASWCGWCRKMASETLTDPKVQAIGDRFSWVKIDIDKDRDAAARFGVEGIPVTVVLDKQDRLLGAHDGYLTPEKFVEFVTKSLENPRPDELLPNLLERFAKSTKPADRREALGRLVEQLALPDRDRKSVV